MAEPPEGRRPLRFAGDLLTSPLRVHAIIDGLSVGGAEMLLCELAAVAPAARIALSVAYLTGAKGDHAATRMREFGVHPVDIGITALSPRALLQVRRNIADAAPDVVHTHLGYSDLLGSIAARSLGVPSVSTVHAMRWDEPLARERAKEAMMTAARRWAASRVITVSDVARERYLAEGRDRAAHVVVVRNGVVGTAQPGAGSRVRAELGLPPDALVVSMISALRREKAHDVAIEAVRRLRERDPRVHLLIAGAGGMLEEIRRAAAPVGDGVVLAGYRSDVMAMLDATDVLLHPAHFDALPTTLIEAAAASTPVLATRVGGIPEIVEDGRTGVLVDAPPRPEMLADELAALLADPARRAALGAAARKRFEREFSAGAWAQRLRGVYDDVVGRA